MTAPLRILYLEDDPADAELVAATLAGEGMACECVQASTRSQFISALDAPFDLILSDFAIPGFDGVSAQALARERRPDLPFVFVSGAMGEELAIERLKEGATDYILKHRLARLPAAVRRALAEQRERRDRQEAEAEVRRLNAELEQRVEQRTGELAEANETLRRRELELADAQLFLEHLIAASPTIVFRLDLVERDLVTTYVSPNIRMLGYSSDEVLGRRGFWQDVLHPEDRQRDTEFLAAALGSATAPVEQEFRWRAKDGEYRWFLANMRVAYDDQTQPLVLLCHALDITDRKQAEQALAETQERTRLILETAHDAFIATGTSGAILDWNLAAERIFGWTRAEALGQQLDALIVPGRDREAYRAGMHRYLASGEARILNPRLELTALRRSGDEFPVELVVWRIDSGPHATLNAFIRDITEQRRAAETVREVKEEAERANRARSEFLSRMRHDLRTPLNAILGFAQLMELDARSPEESDNALQVLQGGRHLLELINKILDIASIEAGRLSLSPESVSVADVVEQVVALIRPLAAARNIDCTVETATIAGRYVRADRQRLRQVLVNLLGNAVKYNHFGGSVRVFCEGPADGRVRISVADTGAGISPEKLALLFRPFERPGGAGHTVTEGTGLGLALAKGLVEVMSGTIDVESVLNRGTIFRVELPAAEAPEVRAS